jgi:hypothetical protein
MSNLKTKGFTDARTGKAISGYELDRKSNDGPSERDPSFETALARLLHEI